MESWNLEPNPLASNSNPFPFSIFLSFLSHHFKQHTYQIFISSPLFHIFFFFVFYMEGRQVSHTKHVTAISHVLRAVSNENIAYSLTCKVFGDAFFWCLQEHSVWFVVLVLSFWDNTWDTRAIWTENAEKELLTVFPRTVYQEKQGACEGYYRNRVLFHCFITTTWKVRDFCNMLIIK